MPQYVIRNSYDLREVAISSTELLNNKLQELIDYTQIELGKFRTVEKAFCVDSLFEELGQIFKYEAKDKSNELKFETNSKQKLWIIADRNRIRQLLIKLISNGSKYTNNGVITVSAIESAHDFDITFQVKDTGSGISKEKLGLILSDDPNARRLQEQSLGCTKLPGLGLIITRKVCEHMNSKLKVNSAKGKGSTFSFKLLLCKIPNGENYKENTTSSLGRGAFRDIVTMSLTDQRVKQQKAKSFSTRTCNDIPFEKYIVHPIEELKTALNTNKGIEKNVVSHNNVSYPADIEQIPIEPSVKTCNRFFCRQSSAPVDMEGIVLIADDYVGNRIVLSQMLTKLHIKSVQARDGMETCKIVKESFEGSKKYGNIELIFMDLDMPEMDGIQAAKNIRIMEEKLNRSKRIPIAVVTAFNTEEDKQICLKAGMQYFYSKPLAFSAVKALVKIHCKGFSESMSEQYINKTKL
jgi:CheY-like chemotaxis protein